MLWLFKNIFLGEGGALAKFTQNLATKFVVALIYNITQYLFILGKFNKFTIGLHFLLISSMLAKYLEN